MENSARFLRRDGALPVIGLLIVAGLIMSLARPGKAEMPFKDVVSVARRGTELTRIDRQTGGTVSSMPINAPAGSDCDFRGGSGLAVNPVTGELFALLNCGPDGPRLLALVDTFDGNATIIGDTGDFFSGLAFSDEGTLYAITGNGANSPNTLFTMNTTDASVSAVCQLAEQPMFAGGQAMAFNSGDGLLYHASGNSDGGTRIFESIDDVTPTDPLAPCPVTPRGPTGDPYEEATALVYSGSSFFLADLGDVSEGRGRFYNITSGGVATLIGEMDQISKGLAFINAPAEICYKVKRDDAAGPNESVAIEDAIVGPRAAFLKLKKAFSICVPGDLRFTSLSTLSPDGSAGEAEEESNVTGEICYRVKKDDSDAAKKTDLKVADQANGERTVRIKTRKAFVVCEKALINTNALP